MGTQHMDMWTRLTVVGLAVALSLGLASPSSVDAQTCIPTAIGVPGQPGPPTWWSGAGAIDDERWQGSLSYGHNNDDVQFRALTYVDGAQKYLVLSWDVKVDAGPAAGNEDYLYVGFWDPVLSQGNIIKVTRNTATSVTDGTAGGGELLLDMRRRDGTTSGSWSVLVPPPPSAWAVSDTRLGATCVLGSCSTWNVRMRVPIGNAGTPVSNPVPGLPMPDTFRMWYEVHVEQPGPSIVSYKWPAAATTVSEPIGLYPDPTAAAQWSDMSVVGGTCETGVSLDYGQITTDNAGSSHITTENPNVFHARPLNETGAAIGGDQIRARFRIANWGSVLFDSPEWTDINPSSPSCASATGAAGMVADGANFDLTCTWDLTDEQKCAYRPDVFNTCTPMPPQRHAHQCILVELSSSTGVLFSRSSAWNNMNFVTTSKFERTATISIRGLPPMPGGAPTRDVYLYVTTQNMPVAASPSDNDSPPTDSRGDQAREQGNEKDVKQPKLPSANQAKGFVPVSVAEAARYAAQMREGKLTMAQVADQMPTYVVHVYYDTGERVTKGATEYVVMESMPSFGYFVAHDGEIYGWQHVLEGAVELAPNFYKVAAPNDGSVEVKTTIESVEAPPAGAEPEPASEPPPPGTPWWIWLLIALAIAVLLALLLRRRP